MQKQCCGGCERAARERERAKCSSYKLYAKMQWLYSLHCIISMFSQCDHQIHRHLLGPRLMPRNHRSDVCVCLGRTATLKNITNVNIWSKRRWFDRSPFWASEQANIFIPFSLIACRFASRWNFEVSVFGSMMPFWSFSFFSIWCFFFSCVRHAMYTMSLCLPRVRSLLGSLLRLHPFGMPFRFLLSFDVCMFLLMRFFLMNNFFLLFLFFIWLLTRVPTQLFAFVMQWSFISNILFDFSAAWMPHWWVWCNVFKTAQLATHT